MIGVGGLVVDSNNRILVVKERFWKTPSWKLPGGFVEAGNYFLNNKIFTPIIAIENMSNIE